MNKLNLLPKLASVGVAALGAITSINIISMPSQAASFEDGSTLEWDNGTDSFIDEVEFSDGDVFDVVFSPSAFGGVAAVFIESGSFSPYFIPGTTYTINGGAGATGDFVFSNLVTPPAPGVVVEAVYELANPLTFVFEPVEVPGASVTATLAAGSNFLGELFPDGSVDFELEGGVDGAEWLVTINDPNLPMDIGPQFAVSSVLEFGQTDGSPGGGYVAEATMGVPEPSMVLGLLAVSGLGFGLKGKKKS
jgi:hypothetical protein